MTSMSNLGGRGCDSRFGELCACYEPLVRCRAPRIQLTNLHDRCSSKNAREGASCYAAPTGELTAPTSSMSPRAPCTAANLYASVKLRNNEYPPAQAARWHCVATSRCKCMLQVFQLFRMNVASRFIWMLQKYI
jgi:hypothetical protein